MPKIQVEWTEDSLEDLEKLDPPIQKRILRKIDWFREHFLTKLQNPYRGN